MDTIQKPIFEMKMTGEVTPQTVPASLLGEFIIHIEKSVLAVLGEDTETGKGNDVALMSLVGVTEGSNKLSLASPATVIPAIGIIAEAILLQEYDRIPRKAHEHLYEANKLCHRHGWGIEIVANERYSILGAAIAPGALIPAPKPPKKAKGTTTIIGQVIKAGGVDPKVHIKTNDKQSFHISVTEELAKELAGRLYQTVSLECRVAWNMDDWTYDKNSITVVKLSPYRGKTRPSEAFDRLRASSGGRWEGVDPLKYVKEQYQEDSLNTGDQ